MPTAGEGLQSDTWKYNTWRRTEHSASSQEANDNWNNKFAQDESNVIINTETARGREFRDDNEADQSKIETVRFGKSETNVRDPCVLFYDELSRRDNKRIESSKVLIPNRTQVIVKRNASEQMVLTVRISCSGTRARSLMIVSRCVRKCRSKLVCREIKNPDPEVPGGARDPED